MQRSVDQVSLPKKSSLAQAKTSPNSKAKFNYKGVQMAKSQKSPHQHEGLKKATRSIQEFVKGKC